MLVRSKRLLSLILALLMMVSLLSACGGAKPEVESASPTASPTASVEESTASSTAAATEVTEAPTVAPVEEVTIDSATDSSELPDWNGKQLLLRVWQAHGTGAAKRVVSPNDVVTPEIKRVTGIELDKDNSFDNAGQDSNARLSILAASNDWPALVINGNSLDQLVKGEKLYDLTELIPKYCPHIWADWTSAAPTSVKEGYNFTGKQYRVPTSIYPGPDNLIKIVPDLDLTRYNFIASPTDTQGGLSYIMVRDDILKILYPTAKTQKEIEDLYMKNGKFTREEIYDVPLKSKEDVIKFFYDISKVIKDNKITESGKPVYATFANNGQDNWPEMSWLNNQWNGLIGMNYFTYFDGESKKIEIGFKTDLGKSDMLVWNKFVRDGVASKESLIDNNEQFTNKMNNGEYAIGFAWVSPDKTKLKAANKPYDFRKVYFDIPANSKKFLPGVGELNFNNWVGIIKDAVKEEDVPQILAWLDFLASDVGDKLTAWGPKTAGLWEENNGKRKFTNKEVEDCIVFDVPNGANVKYNLQSTIAGEELAWPGIPFGVGAGGIFSPKYMYDRSGSTNAAGNADRFFATGLFDPMPTLKGIIPVSADIWNFTETVPEIKAFWNVRGTGFEPLMTKCFAAKSDEEFEAAYKRMVDFATQNQLSDESMVKLNAFYQEKHPESYKVYMDNYK